MKIEHLLRSREERKIGPRFWAGFRAFLIAWAIGIALDYSGAFRWYNQSDLDHYTRNRPVDAPISERITVVQVNDEDYRVLFGATSPLDPATVLKLIRTLQSYRPAPRIIAVDFLTEDWKEPLPVNALLRDHDVIWARAGQQVKDRDGQATDRLELYGVAGFDNPPKHICAAPPFLPRDADGGVRRYYTAVETGKVGRQTIPTMPYLLASVFPDKPLDCEAAPPLQTKLIEFTGKGHNIPTIPASSVLADRGRALASRISNRIVLIGAAYRAARDYYWTPGGYMFGVKVVAHAVETEISGGRRELSVWESALVTFVTGTCFLLAAYMLRQPYDLILSGLAPVLFAFVGGWIFYNEFGFFIGLASTMLGVPIGVSVQHYVEHLQLTSQ